MLSSHRVCTTKWVQVRIFLVSRLKLTEAIRSELKYFVATQPRMSKSVEVQLLQMVPINIFNLIISSLLSSNFLGCLFVFFTFVYVYRTESFSGNAGMAFNCTNDSLRIINSKILASLFLVIWWWIFCDFLGRFFPLHVHVCTHTHRDSHTSFANADTSLFFLWSF